jgi:hypothetical protein
MRKYQGNIFLYVLIKEDDRLVYAHLKQLNSVYTENFQCYRIQICVLETETYVDYSQV